ncbi:carboxylating nicotinate-nucleotide diphosphorylase [candidate division KSB1 bacterium]|nr:carboxylating nicotinate-nucleotide diphosphorylase [candidate division KSB1 bacterium]
MDNTILNSAQLLIENALEEDLGHRGDITTQAMNAKSANVSARIIAKQSGIVSGLDIAIQVFKFLDPAIQFTPKVKDGDRVEPADILLLLHGPAHAILSAERTALNFLGRLSGIATLAFTFSQQIKNTETKILDTRKTTPGWRTLEKYAVKCGGCGNHRIGLYDMFLIKENHITTAGSITKAVTNCRDYMEKNHFTAAIEVETKSIAEVKEALRLNVDRIMLDNMNVELISECVGLVNGRIPLEASGNITLKNIKQIADTGVDFISTGAITHSAVNFDASLVFD